MYAVVVRDHDPCTYTTCPQTTFVSAEEYAQWRLLPTMVMLMVMAGLMVMTGLVVIMVPGVMLAVLVALVRDLVNPRLPASSSRLSDWRRPFHSGSRAVAGGSHLVLDAARLALAGRPAAVRRSPDLERLQHEEYRVNERPEPAEPEQERSRELKQANDRHLRVPDEQTQDERRYARQKDVADQR